jgi:hypothetical protein
MVETCLYLTTSGQSRIFNHLMALKDFSQAGQHRCTRHPGFVAESQGQPACGALAWHHYYSTQVDLFLNNNDSRTYIPSLLGECIPRTHLESRSGVVGPRIRSNSYSELASSPSAAHGRLSNSKIRAKKHFRGQWRLMMNMALTCSSANV